MKLIRRGSISLKKIPSRIITLNPMNRIFRRPGIGIQPSLIGKEPTAQQKIINRARSMGIGGMEKMQGTAQVLFDTVAVTASANRTQYSFFKNVGGKSRNFTNFQKNELIAGESLALQYINIMLLTVSNNTLLNQDTTTINTVEPVGLNSVSTQLMFGMLQIKIANDVVLKDYQLIQLHPVFNDKSVGIAAFDNPAANADSILGRTRIELPGAGFFLPPNQPLEIILELPPITFVANSAIMMSIGDVGSIFSTRGTL